MTAIGAPPYPSLNHGLWDEWSLANREGFTNLGTYNPNSRLPSGGPSDHARYPSWAFDAGFSGGGWSNKQARHFFEEMEGRPGIHYVILGDKIWSTERGLHSYTYGGHDSHVHVSGDGTDVAGGTINPANPGSEAIVNYIARGAFRRGDDPGVYLSVAAHEGGFDPNSDPGDGGTSFGPFQLHEGGQLPAGLDHPSNWAWSRAGLDYAMDRIDAAVPDHLEGRNAIELMVRNFERPQNPEAEIQKANMTYQQAKASGALPPPPSQFISSPDARPWKRGFWTHGLLPDFGIPTPSPGKIAGAVIPDGITNFFVKAAWPFTHPLRFVQIIGGALLVIIGLVMLGKNYGVPMPSLSKLPIPVPV